MGLTIDHIVSKYDYLHETDMMLAQYLEYFTAENFYPLAQAAVMDRTSVGF